MLKIKRINVIYSKWLPLDIPEIWIPRKINAACGCHLFVFGPFMLEITLKVCNFER